MRCDQHHVVVDSLERVFVLQLKIRRVAHPSPGSIVVLWRNTLVVVLTRLWTNSEIFG